MSRSIHKTIKGVFGGKSKSTINEMIAENDPDVEELGKKYSYKYFYCQIPFNSRYP